MEKLLLVKNILLMEKKTKTSSKSDKPDMPKDTQFNLQTNMINISKSLSGLKNCNNIPELIESREKINLEIKKVEDHLNKLKVILHEKPHDKPNNLLDLDSQTAFDFDSRYKEIIESYKNFWDDIIPLDQQIEKYNKLVTDLNKCMKYLETKKMEVTYVD